MEIKGIELFMKSAEFAAHCAKRAEFHGQRARVYLDKADEMRKMRRENPNPTFDDDETIGKVSNYRGQVDPIESLEQLSASHRGKAERFRFMAEHAVSEATYRLTLMDLQTLEIGV